MKAWTSYGTNSYCRVRRCWHGVRHSFSSDWASGLGLRRQCDALPSEIRPFVADVTKPETLQVLPPALDFVFYTAAPDHSTEEGYQSTYVDGLHHLLAALAGQPHKLRHFFFTSSTGVYGQTTGEWVDETSLTEPEHFSGTLQLAAEQVVLNSGFPATVVRLGVIYGPGRTRLIDTVRQGPAVCSDESLQFTNRIHRDDCAGVLRHLMELPQPDRLYLGVDHEPADTCTVMH